MSLLLSARSATSLQARRSFSSSAGLNADFTHAVIGGGAVGLAIARRLQQQDASSTVLIEKHGDVGTETSSRNSEVIHAGLYYGTDTVKARLCIEGKKLLYALCEKHSIPHRNTGKWIVAQDEAQYRALEKIHSNAKSLSIPTRFLTPTEIRETEPSVRAEAGALLSPTTGILDSHSYMSYLQSSFTDLGGDVALASTVSHIIAPGASSSDWEVHITDPSDPSTTYPITAQVLINSAGLSAIPLSNSILPPERRRKAHYAKGTYFSYGSSHPRPKTLVYPAPVEGHGGLGTHLTLDLQGRIRFGPDVQWVEDPGDYTPNVDEDRFGEAVEEIRSYLPDVDRSKIEVDYCGIRPKLAGKNEGGGKDFYIVREEGFGGAWINLLGIESPGLTASLGIGEEVWRMLYR